ncbi:hypothetical protein ScPMuIL_013558 [Solemya velum]
MASATGKRRNSEKRKEKSRDAARSRRSKETEVFTELAEQLPLPKATCSQLDKASVMRLAISILKIWRIMNDRIQGKSSSELDKQYPKALEGFIIIISKEGDLIFVSEAVSKFLGIQQIDLMGQSIYEFVHPCDHDEIRDILSIRPHKKNGFLRSEIKTFFMRLKCTLTSKGRNVNLKSATYKVIKCMGRLTQACTVNEDKVFDKNDETENGISSFLLAIAEPIPHPSNIESPLDSRTFLSRHSMDMKFTYCDERIKELIGYNSEKLIGHSLFNYHHALDSDIVVKAFKDLFAKGQTMTGQYRFLAKKGGYVWIITQGTIIYNSRTQKPQCIVCVHYVLSDIESWEQVLSDVQQTSPEEDFLPPYGPTMSTESVFFPKTKEMEKDFYFPPGFKKKISVDEIVDLTHLAPKPGEIVSLIPVITLDTESSATCEDIADGDKDLLKNDPPLPIFKEEPGLKNNSVCQHPREQGQSTLSSAATSPMSQSSPMNYSRCSSPDEYRSTINPNDIDAMDKFFSVMDTHSQESSHNKANEVCLSEIDMTMRAPYIPMDPEDDLTLLPVTSETLYNTLSPDFNPGLFGRTESVFIPKGKVINEPSHHQRQQSLRDMLGESTAVASIEQPTDTFLLQMKRPLDMNHLEKGPPAHKVPKVQKEEQQEKLITKDSVLLNLLLTGEDRDHGYSVHNSLTRRVLNQVEFPEPDENKESLMRTILPKITNGDCEVNAPITSSRLLQGEDLLYALDVEMPTPATNIIHTI